MHFEGLENYFLGVVQGPKLQADLVAKGYILFNQFVTVMILFQVNNNIKEQIIADQLEISKLDAYYFVIFSSSMSMH